MRAPAAGLADYDATRCDVYYQGKLSPDFYAWIFPANIECADTFWSVHFMRGHGKQVDLVCIYIHRNFTNCLCSVCKSENAMFAGDLADLAHRHDRTDLVVRRHNRDKDGLVRHRFANLLVVDRPKRYYPAGEAIGHMIGYVSEISEALEVGLEKPGPLAQLLLRNDPAWQPEQIDAALATGKTQRVQLQPQDQVQVYLLYWTAFASANGQMNFRGDPYGWDKTLAAKIERRSAITAVAAR